MGIADILRGRPQRPISKPSAEAVETANRYEAERRGRKVQERFAAQKRREEAWARMKKQSRNYLVSQAKKAILGKRSAPQRRYSRRRYARPAQAPRRQPQERSGGIFEGGSFGWGQ